MKAYRHRLVQPVRTGRPALLTIQPGITRQGSHGMLNSSLLARSLAWTPRQPWLKMLVLRIIELFK